MNRANTFLLLSRKVSALSRPLSKVAPLGLTFGFAPVLCNPHPGSCLGLEIGDELIVTIEETMPHMDSPCDYEALGWTVGEQLRLSVDEQIENSNGERVYCSVSTGRLKADTGWTYYRSSKSPEIYDSYSTVIDASKAECHGEISLMVFVEDPSVLKDVPRSATVGIAFKSFGTAMECPPSCSGGLIGSMVRTR